MYSLRMRATASERHISGAERIVQLKDVQSVVKELADRAVSHENGMPNSIKITLEEITGDIQYIPALPLTSITTRNHEEAVKITTLALTHHAIPQQIAHHAIDLIQEGGAPGGRSMRGAMVMNYESGLRIEPDRERGVRATRMDMSQEAGEELKKNLSAIQLSDRAPMIKEALTLASKVASLKTIAEICISDNLSNHTGYVASEKIGFLRIPHLKEKQVSIGGRIFFVPTTINLEEYIKEVEEKPVIIDQATSTRVISTGEFTEELKRKREGITTSM
ncbi:MAG TPA: 6-carboxyhexanoate--CoA ligase [Candidatus Methanoperedenaceae archaeon]|nr:6-carboxyhexanoate--CoA ligase [Candidatus Methanoperedenaceae archaeon]